MRAWFRSLPTRIRGLGLIAAVVVTLIGWPTVRGQTPPVPSPTPTPAPAPAPNPLPAALPGTNSEILEELKRLRSEVQEARQLRDQVQRLQDEVNTLRGQPPSLFTEPVSGPAGGGAGSTVPGWATGAPTGSGGGPDRFASGNFGGDSEPPDADRYRLGAFYKYNHNATGPLGGGGFFSVTDPDGEFSLNVSNQITADGTFIDRQGMPTSEQGFNVPFARTFIYGNITKDWSYQVGTQSFLGTFNILDVFMAWHINDYVTLRAGKGLAPSLYEYYAFSPALEPVITNSPLFQLAGKRPLGLMFSGNLLGNRIQWWSGISNSGASLFGNLDRTQDYNGAIDITPFRGDAWKDTVWEGLGGGVGFQSGWQQYSLQQGGTGFINNGESTTNPVFTTVLGIPWYVYNKNISAFGMQSQFAPHIYWYGRFSVLAEMMNFSRVLTDGTTIGRSTQWAYYVNTSYWLTGERDFMGNGFQGYSTIEPLRPFIPSRGEYGPGAWQIAAQWSEFNAGLGDINRGFVDRARSTNRMGNFMAGVNWWPNKYTRLSFDYVWTGFNNPIPLSGTSPVSQYQTFWMRFAMFF